MTDRKKLGVKWLARLVGPVLAAVIYYQLDVAAALDRTLGLSLETVAAAAFLSILTVVVRGGRWYLVLARLDHDAPILRVIAAQFIGAAMGAVTPGKLGEFFKIAYIRKPDNPSTGKLLLSAFIERLFDMAGLLFCGFVAFTMIILDRHAMPTDMASLLIMVVGASALGVIGWSQRVRIIRAVIAACRALAFEQLAERLQRGSEYLNDIGHRDVFLLFGMTLVSWLGYFVTFGVVVKGFGIGMDFFVLSACAAFAAIIVALPLSISGVGTRDAALIYSFSIFGVVSVDAVAVAFVLLALNLLVSVVGIFFMLYFSHRNQISIVDG